MHVQGRVGKAERSVHRLQCRINVIDVKLRASVVQLGLRRIHVRHVLCDVVRLNRDLGGVDTGFRLIHLVNRWIQSAVQLALQLDDTRNLPDSARQPSINTASVTQKVFSFHAPNQEARSVCCSRPTLL
jgi:hypothetical protein